MSVSPSEGRLPLKNGPSVKDCGLRVWLKEEALKRHGSMASSQNVREPRRDPAQHYPTFIRVKVNAGPYVMVAWVTVLTDVQMDSGCAHSVFIISYLIRLFITFNYASMSKHGAICSVTLCNFILYAMLITRICFFTTIFMFKSDNNVSAGSTTQGTLLICPERIQCICCRKKNSL